MIRVLFVCLGNICRSPTAHGVMLGLLESEGLNDQVFVDSAGTAGSVSYTHLTLPTRLMV